MIVNDVLYRSVNALGFIANAISMGLPYGSPEREAIKIGSQFINMFSAFAGVVSPSRDGAIKGLASGFACLTDVALLDAAKNLASEDAAQRYMYEGYSMAVQGLNAWHGLHKQAKPA